MRRLLRACAILPCLAISLFAQDSPPTNTEQAKLLASMRHYAEQYIANLPNFTCIQVTEQYEAGVKTNKWKKGDTVSSKLVFSQGKEQRTLELVNNKPVQPGKHNVREPLVTEGEFGVLLGNIFEALSDTEFKWRGWEDRSGKKLMIFDYSIDKAHSGLSVGLSESVEAVVPYFGSVYADPADGSVWRVTQNVTDIPEEIRTKSTSTEIDYQQQTIGGTQYLLPVHATVLLDTGLRHIRNELAFQDYRKFDVESNITFTPEPDTTNKSPH